MAHYLVGKRGFLKETWEFTRAIEAANDGDVIELEKGYCPFNTQKNQGVTIRKSITIEGTLSQDAAGCMSITNVIDGVVVLNGATVTLRNLEIRKNLDKHNNISVRERSTVVLDTVIVSSYATVGENYPIIYADGNSQVQLTNVEVVPGNIHDRKYRMYAKDSSLQILNSTLNCQVKVENSKVECRNSMIRYQEANAFFASKSNIELADSFFEGGAQVEKESWPCLRITASQLHADNIRVSQPKYTSAFSAVNSKVRLDTGVYDSMKIEQSDVTFGVVEIMESLLVYHGSDVRADSIFIHGRDNGKVNLWMDKRTSLEAIGVYFGKPSVPNVKIERNISFQVELMQRLQYNAQAEEFVICDDEEHPFIVEGDVPEIEYFGEVSALERLNQMVGIRSAKEAVEEFVAIASMNKKRAEQGVANTAFSLHSLFLGNPGTGKTTVARLVGEILYEQGVISSKTFVETSRSDLVGQYIGHTAKQTRDVLESALGGVLFIDEAYTLWTGAEDTKDFGLEAINEILKFMEDHRQDIVIIFAGYTHSMEKFLQSNEGLKSRIPNTFMFEDYTEEELIQIGLGDLEKQKYEIDEKAYSELVYRNFAKSDDKSNGRWVRNLNEQLIRKMAVRTARNRSANLSLITQDDIDAVAL